MQSRADDPRPPQASAEDTAAWASVPWTPLTDPGTSDSGTGTGTPIGWHKAGVPYLPSGKAVSLQTLDVWIPNNNTTPAPPDPSSRPHLPGTWIVYIHGGAWRDPFISSSSFTAAATKLLVRHNSSYSTTNGKIAGLVSLNYRLSPHPSHPSPADPSRQAHHPDHIADILTALSFLQRMSIPSDGTEWILAGHSCGATLALQAVMSPVRWGPDPVTEVIRSRPTAIVGFNGLYDLAGFIADPPRGYEHLREGYRQFVEGAFGEDESVWRGVCPATAGEGWVGEWVGDDDGEGEGEGRGKKGEVVMVQSRGDSLVPWRQVEAMRECLEREGRGRVEVSVLEAEGEHDEIWREGGRMAEVLWEVVGGL